MRKVRVVIDARIPAEGWGGVQQVVIGLAAGHTAVAQPDLDVLYLCYPEGPDWLGPYVEPAQQFKLVRPPARTQTARSKSWVSAKLPAVRRAYHALMPPPPVPRTDGTLEALDPDIVHFPHQSAFLTSVRSIYQPHDLQHRHLPQFFTKRDIATRESFYRSFCKQASLVAMATTWGRDDIIRAYGLLPEKVAVVPLAPVIDRYPELSEDDLKRVRMDLRLPNEFCYYPAQTWPHKNHERLLRAVAQLRVREQLVIPMVFSGAATSHRKDLDALVRKLGLEDDVSWVGFVEPAKVRALYRLSRCVVVPTLFESASQPIFEAMSAGVAIACSNVTATPRQVGDAAVVFDPYSIDQISSAIKRLWIDSDLREQLIERGRRRISQFTWERTAVHFAAYYRQLSGRSLSAQDQALISADPII